MRMATLCFVSVLMMSVGSVFAQDPVVPDPTAAAVADLETKVSQLTDAVEALRTAVGELPTDDASADVLKGLLEAQQEVLASNRAKLNALIAAQAVQAAAAALPPAAPFLPLVDPTAPPKACTVYGLREADAPHFLPSGTEYHYTNYSQSHHRCFIVVGNGVKGTAWYIEPEQEVNSGAEENGGIDGSDKKATPETPGYLVVFTFLGEEDVRIQVSKAIKGGTKVQTPLGHVYMSDGQPRMKPDDGADRSVAVEGIEEAIRTIEIDIRQGVTYEEAGQNLQTNEEINGSFDFREKAFVEAFCAKTWCVPDTTK